MASDEHTLTPPRRVPAHPRGDGLPFWEVRCSCGRYGTGPVGSPGQAERAGEDHKRAKEANRG